MKIVFLHRFKVVGGAERQLVELARGLHQRGHEVTLVTFYPGGVMLGDAERAGLRIVSLDKSGRWDVIPFLLRLIRTLARERADVVHGYLGFANALLVLTKPIHRAPVVWGVRSSDIDISRYHRLARFDAWIEQTLSRFPDLILANSHAGKAHAISRGFPSDKITVIPNGIDLDRFQRDEAGRLKVRAEWGVGEDERLIGRVARMDPQKDYPTFLRAAAIFARKRPETKFAVVGHDRYGSQGELAALAAELDLGDRVIWAGQRTDMAAVHSAFDLCVSSSAFGEGTPNVLAEAMACGTPCVTTDAGDSAITVGELGIVVPRSDPQALAAGICQALDRKFDPDELRGTIARNLSMERLISSSERALAGVARPGQQAARRQEARS
jgi:glycosyltransferase involved in cell wall biosynthesis